jgi:hypothetical protein
VPRKIFVAGEILTAADVNTNLMDQAVMVFDDSAARGSAIPTPSEGMVTYLSDVNALEVYTGAAFVPAASGATLGAGSILQVVSTTKADTFSTTSTTFTDVTGLTATITPRSTSSKIMIFATLTGDGTLGGTILHSRLVRGATAISIGDADGIRTRNSSSLFSNANTPESAGITFLDSPATTSSITYGVQVRVDSSTGYVNRTSSDSDAASTSRPVSSITLMEVAG